MINSYSRSSKLFKLLAKLQAMVVIVTLVSSTFLPVVAVAQTTDAIVPSNDTSIVLDPEAPTEDPVPPQEPETDPAPEEPKPEEPSFIEEAANFITEALNLEVNVPVQKTITVTKVLGGGVQEACTDFSFSIENSNNVILTQAFEADCTNVVPIEENGSYLVYETAATSAGYSVAYNDSVNPNNTTGCHLQGINDANPARTCTITNSLIPELDGPTGKLVVEKLVVGGEADPTDFSFQVKDGETVVATHAFLLNDGPNPWQGPNKGRTEITLPAGEYTVVEVPVDNYTATYNGGNSEPCEITVVADGPKASCGITNTYEEPELTQCSFVSDNENNYVDGNNAVVVTAHPAWTTALSGAGAEWIWASPDATGTNTFTRTINVTGIAGTAQLEIAADNGYDVAVNGSSVGITCDGSGTSNFGALETCTIPVVNGVNTLEFTANNFGGPADANAGNPAGLYYRVSFEATSCTDEEPVQESEVTLCKVDEEGNPLSGWTLTLKGENVQTGLGVSSTLSGGVNSNPLVAGVSYIATVFGTWNNQGGANVVDAEYSTTDGWATQMDGYTGYQTDILELQIDSAFDPNSDWGAYNSAHTYARGFTVAADGAANFRIFDGTGTSQNLDWFNDNSGSLTVNIDEGYAGITEQNGCVTFENVPYGTYTVGEIEQDGWSYVETKDGEETVEGETVTVDSETETFTVVNEEEGEEGTATIHGTKIICDSETDLPNWGTGGADITSTTASDFLAAHPNCYEADWTFEWRTGSTSSDPYNPGDNVAAAGDPWTTFTDMASVPAGSLIWVREQASASYIPFTGSSDDVSAEIYCANDVLNYDNFDFIDPVEEDGHYYCVAFNVPTDGSSEDTCVLVSDETTIEGEVDASLVSTIHSAWTAVINAASWIWGEDPTADPVNGDTQTFTKTFTLDSVVSGATLEIAADNTYTVEINGNPVGADATEVNYSAAGQDTIIVPVNVFVVGDNTLTIEVTNLPQAGGTAASNPGGLLYKLTIDGASCDEEPVDETATLTIIKEAVGGDGTFTFEVTPDGEVIPSVTAATSTDITTVNGAGSATFELEPGTYDVEELAQENWNLDGVICTHDDDQLVLDAVAGGSQIIISDEDDDVTCTFTNFFDEDGGDPDVQNFTYVITEDDLVTLGDLIGSPSLATDPESWFFYNDETDVIDNTLGSFVVGPDTAPLGNGSAQASVTGTERRNLATYQFKDVALADIDELSFSTYSQSAGNGSPASERSAYLNFNVDFANNDTWQRRLVFLPADNGIVVNDTWQTWDAIDGGTALWRYSGNFWPDGSVSDGSIPGTTPRTWNDILADYPVAETRSTDSWFGFRVGEPYADGFTSNVDNFVLRVNDGSTDVTKTYDFEPTVSDQVPDPEDDDTDQNRSGSRSGGGGSSSGQVLGATTDGTCDVLLHTFMRLGMNNDSSEVMKLQTFLNLEMGSGLPVTGFFGALTDAAVKAFQLKYSTDVLVPWVGLPASGIDNSNDDTGYVYKTTQWKINMIHCPELNLPFPTLD